MALKLKKSGIESMVELQPILSKVAFMFSQNMILIEQNHLDLNQVELLLDMVHGVQDRVLSQLMLMLQQQ